MSSLPISSLRTTLLSGTLWMFGMRWMIRLLGIISVAVLARLLDKEDFGLATMASAIIALPMFILDFGVEQAIIREQNPERGMYNTAWTIRFIQMVIVAICIYAAADIVADFYNDERLSEILHVLSVMVAINGLENIWTVSFRKKFDFKKDFLYNTITKLLAVCVTIYLAFELRSYWALIYGQIAAAALRLIVSLVVAPEWPRPSLSHIRALWSFSQWSLVYGLATYVIRHADRLILGRLTSVDALGAYAVGREIADLPISEISAPINRALGPGFAKLQDDPRRLGHAFGKSLGAVCTITLPVAVGLAITAEQLVPVLLGDGWTATIPILQILAFSSMITTVRSVMGNTLTVIGYVRSSAVLMWLRALLLIAIGIPGAVVAGTQGMALSFLISEGLAFAATVTLCRHHLPQLTGRILWQVVQRPGASVLVMLALVLAVDHSGLVQPLPLLASKVAVGVCAYGATLYALWRCAGCPDGIESAIMQRLDPLRRFISR